MLLLLLLWGSGDSETRKRGEKSVPVPLSETSVCEGGIRSGVLVVGSLPVDAFKIRSFGWTKYPQEMSAKS